MRYFFATLNVSILTVCTIFSLCAQTLETPHGITLKSIHADGENYTFILTNHSNKPFAYLHWVSRGSRPVLSIETVAGNKIERYDEWPIGEYEPMTTHQQFLFPGEQVEFEVSRSALRRVGIQYLDENMDEKILWSAEIKR